MENGDSVLPVDLSHLRKFTGGDREAMRALCSAFMEQARPLLRNLGEICGEAQQENWRQAAHKLKGSAANLGAGTLFTVMLAAERGLALPEREKRVMLEGIARELDAVHGFLKEQLGDF